MRAKQIMIVKKCPAISSCEKIPVYRLPSDEEEKNKWIQAVILYICCLWLF